MVDLYNYQAKIVYSPSEKNCFVGARQTGKTTACIEAAKEWHSEFDQLFYVGPSERMVKDARNDGYLKDVENIQIYSSNGLSDWRPDKIFRGGESQCLIVDEADFVDWSVFPDFDDYFDRVFVAGTPFSGQSGPFYEFSRDSDTKLVHASCFECPEIDKHFLREWREEQSDTIFAKEGCGLFVG